MSILFKTTFTIFLVFSMLGSIQSNTANLLCPTECTPIYGQESSGYCRPDGEGTRCFRDPIGPDDNPTCAGTYRPLYC